ncbi:MAG: hypothetical protein WD396_10135 [Pseudohongiellaceae bacterium]
MMHRTHSPQALVPPPPMARMKGFSLFELVVFIISVAIIYAYAANRFSDFPGQAERANFLAVTTQLNSAISLELNFGVGLGRISSPEILEGANPMDLMLEPPRNYLGAFANVDVANLERRSWYFDRSQEELVYLVNDDRGVYLLRDGGRVPTNEIRFAMQAKYRQYDRATGLPLSIVERDGRQVPEQQRVRKLDGILLQPVTPFEWRAQDPEALLETAQNPG